MQENNPQTTVFSTGAKRDPKPGGGRLDLLPPNALLRLAQHFSYGASRYGDRNWEQGIPLSNFFDHGLEHLLRYWAGESDEPHLVAAVWNFLCLLDTEMRIEFGELPEELDDHPRRKRKECSK